MDRKTLHNQAINFIRDRLEHGAYTYDEVCELYSGFTRKAFLNRNVKRELERLMNDYPLWLAPKGFCCFRSGKIKPQR